MEKHIFKENQLAALVYILAIPPLGSTFAFFLQDRWNDGWRFFLRQLLSFLVSSAWLLLGMGLSRSHYNMFPYNMFALCAIISFLFSIIVLIDYLVFWFRNFFDVLRYDPMKRLPEKKGFILNILLIVAVLISLIILQLNPEKPRKVECMPCFGTGRVPDFEHYKITNDPKLRDTECRACGGRGWR